MTSIDGKAVADSDAIAEAVDAHAPGDRIEVQVSRGGATRTLRITLGTRPETAP